MILASRSLFFFFFNDTATTEIYTLSLHDALPIYVDIGVFDRRVVVEHQEETGRHLHEEQEEGDPPHADRKSTRLNSSHSQISYAVFCLKKKRSDRRTPSPRPAWCAPCGRSPPTAP